MRCGKAALVKGKLRMIGGLPQDKRNPRQNDEYRINSRNESHRTALCRLTKKLCIAKKRSEKRNAQNCSSNRGSGICLCKHSCCTGQHSARR
jgi:hypothetical protein